jgi:FeS assembly SUF system protein
MEHDYRTHTGALGSPERSASRGTQDGEARQDGVGSAAAAPADTRPLHSAEPSADMSEDDAELRTAIIDALKQCYDPEIPVDIYELGLIYAVDLDESNRAMIRMTLTSPMCPVAESLPGEVAQRVREVPGVTGAEIDLVWEPAWNPGMMSEAAKLQLGF